MDRAPPCSWRPSRLKAVPAPRTTGPEGRAASGPAQAGGYQGGEYCGDNHGVSPQLTTRVKAACRLDRPLSRSVALYGAGFGWPHGRRGVSPGF